MSSLTVRHQSILEAAGQRHDHTVLPIPSTLKVNAGTAARLLKGLISQGLIETRPVNTGDTVWKTDESNKPLKLVLTRAGLKGLATACKVPKTASRNVQREKRDKSAAGKPIAAAPTAPAKKPPSKLTQIIELMSQPGGIDLKALQERTGWQAHSVRGYISGTLKKKLGLKVGSTVEGGIRRYRIEDNRGR